MSASPSATLRYLVGSIRRMSNEAGENAAATARVVEDMRAVDLIGKGRLAESFGTVAADANVTVARIAHTIDAFATDAETVAGLVPNCLVTQRSALEICEGIHARALKCMRKSSRERSGAESALRAVAYL